jgi:hypothetical protein
MQQTDNSVAQQRWNRKQRSMNLSSKARDSRVGSWAGEHGDMSTFLHSKSHHSANFKSRCVGTIFLPQRNCWRVRGSAFQDKWDFIQVATYYMPSGCSGCFLFPNNRASISPAKIWPRILLKDAHAAYCLRPHIDLGDDGTTKPRVYIAETCSSFDKITSCLQNSVRIG